MNRWRERVGERSWQDRMLELIVVVVVAEYAQNDRGLIGGVLGRLNHQLSKKKKVLIYSVC